MTIAFPAVKKKRGQDQGVFEKIGKFLDAGRDAGKLVWDSLRNDKEIKAAAKAAGMTVDDFIQQQMLRLAGVKAEFRYLGDIEPQKPLTGPQEKAKDKAWERAQKKMIKEHGLQPDAYVIPEGYPGHRPVQPPLKDPDLDDGPKPKKKLRRMKLTPQGRPFTFHGSNAPLTTE